MLRMPPHSTSRRLFRVTSEILGNSILILGQNSSNILFYEPKSATQTAILKKKITHPNTIEFKKNII